MASTTIKKPYIPDSILNGSVSSNLFDFIKSSNCPADVSVWNVQYAPDSPIYRLVATAIISKPVTNGNYSTVLIFGSGALFVSGQINPSDTGLVWKKATLTDV